MMNPLPLLQADLRKNLLTNLAILVLLALSFSGSIALSLFERAFQTAGAESAADFDLIIGAAGSKTDLVLSGVFLMNNEVLPLLDEEVYHRLSEDPRVAAASPLIFADSYDGSPLVGIGDKLPEIRPSLVLSDGRWPEKNFEVVVGSQKDLALGFEFESTHGLGEGGEEHHHEGTYTVVGRLKKTGTPWDKGLYTPYKSIIEIHEHEAAEAPFLTKHEEEEHAEGEEHHDGQVSAVLVKPRSFAAAYALRAEYREGQTTSAFPGEILAQLFGLFDEVKKALSILGTAFQFVVFGAVVLALLANLPSKTRWIGLLRSLGATKTYIFVSLWLQSALIFLAASLVALGLGWWGAQGMASFIEEQSALRLNLLWDLAELQLVAGFFALGLILALFPAVAGFRSSARKALLGQ